MPGDDVADVPRTSGREVYKHLPAMLPVEVFQELFPNRLVEREKPRGAMLVGRQVRHCFAFVHCHSPSIRVYDTFHAKANITAVVNANILRVSLRIVKAHRTIAIATMFWLRKGDATDSQ
jgi:hypothetical protein